jgi:hypothetical protein
MKKTGFRTLFIGLMVWMLTITTNGAAQYSRASTVPAGTEINVRTNEEIDTNDTDGQVFTGVVQNDVRSRSGSVAIPRGSEVELVVKEAGNDLVLDLDSVNINGQRYSIESESDVIAQQKEGVGANKRTGKYVGGGAILGAIIGGIAGGGKGAAIGAGAGAAAGAGAQVLTRGRKIEVPAETLLTYRLAQPIQTMAMNSSYYQNGRYQSQSGRYQSGYGVQTASDPYRAGLRAGRLDADRNLPRNINTNRWSTATERRDYEAGYNAGYDAAQPNSTARRYKPGAGGSVTINGNNNITWQGPENGRVYVYVDNEPRKLFAAGQSGTQPASWIESGHLYVFVLEDANGNEIARDRLDLRQRRLR